MIRILIEKNRVRIVTLTERLFRRPKLPKPYPLLSKSFDSFNLVTDATMFWLPPEQGVFPGATKVNSPSYRVRDVSGEYVLENGTVFRTLGFTLDPRKDSPLFDELKIGGELHGRFYSNIIEGK